MQPMSLKTIFTPRNYKLSVQMYKIPGPGVQTTYAPYNQRDKLSFHIAFPPLQMLPVQKENSKNPVSSYNTFHMNLGETKEANKQLKRNEKIEGKRNTSN